jgi:hypothetical protein
MGGDQSRPLKRDTVLAAVKDGLQALIEWRRSRDGHP